MSKYVNSPLPADVIATILNVHNELRSTVASGKAVASNGNLPTASNMLQMYWDVNIANKAQNWANGCEFKHSDSSYRVSDGIKLGENLYMSSTTNLSEDPNNMGWEKGIRKWYAEIKDYNKDLVGKISFGGPMIGHFTQVIWAQSYLVGCGVCASNSGSQITKLYVCEYGPAGNMVGAANYKTGVPSSACPAGFIPSNAWPGLCCKNGACNKDSISAGAADSASANNDANSAATKEAPSPASVTNSASANSPSTRSSGSNNSASANAPSTRSYGSNNSGSANAPSTGSSGSNTSASANTPSIVSSGSNTSSGNTGTADQNKNSSQGATNSNSPSSSNGSAGSSTETPKQSFTSIIKGGNSKNSKVNVDEILKSIKIEPIKIKKMPVYGK